MRFFSLGLYASILLIGSCSDLSNQKDRYQHQLSKSLRILEKTERILAIDPEKLAGTVDTMKTILSQINAVGLAAIEKSPESKSAYYIYSEAQKAFEKYVIGHDEIFYLTSTHKAQIEQLQIQLEKWDGKDSMVLIEKIEKIDSDVKNNYVHGTELMRDYLGIVNQFNRKRGFIETFYRQITPHNGD